MNTDIFLSLKTKRPFSYKPLTKATSLALAASMVLPAIMPTTAHAQKAETTDIPPCLEVAEYNNHNISILIQQGLQKAKTVTEIKQILAEAQRAFDEAKENYDAAANPYNKALSNQKTAQNNYETANSKAINTRETAENALSEEIQKAQLAATKGENELSEAQIALKNAQKNAAEKQKLLDEATEQAEKATAALSQAKQAAEEATPETLKKAQQDASEAQINLKEAQEKLTRAETELSNAQKEVAAAETKATQAQQQLASSRIEKENADTAVSQATSNLNSAKENLAKAKEGVSEDSLSEAQANIDAAQAELENAQTKQARAENALNEANSAITNAENNLTYAQNNVKQKNESLKKAQGNLSTAQTKASKAEEALTNAKTESANALDAKEKADKAVASAQEAKNNAVSKLEQAENDKKLADAAVVSAQQEIDRINELIDTVNEQAQQGSLGFINWMLNQENLNDKQKKDLSEAKKVLEDATNESFDRYAGGENITWMPERNNMITVIGDEKDATSLNNLKKSIAVMKRINELRASDDNFVGDMQRNASLTNFYFMAVAQTGADRAAGLRRHSVLQTNCENLAFRYTEDPTIGWYTEEKAKFDKIKTDLNITEINKETLEQISKEAKNRNVVIGHYTNLFWSIDQLMGVGFTQYSNTTCYNASFLSNYSKAYASYTIDDFNALLQEYCAFLNNPKTALNSATAQFEQAKTQQTNAGNILIQRQQEANETESVLNQAIANQEKAQKDVELKEQIITEKEQELSNATSAASQAQDELRKAQNEVTIAQNQVTEANNLLLQAKEDSAVKEAELNSAKEETLSAQQKKTTAIEELANLSSELAHAQKAYDIAINALENAINKQEEAERKLIAAQNDAENSTAALKEAKENQTEKQVRTNKAQSEVSQYTTLLDDTQNELNRLNGLIQEVNTTQQKATESEESLLNAQKKLEEANNSVTKMESFALEKMQNYSTLIEYLESAEAINPKDAFENGIQDARFRNLDSLYVNARQAQKEANKAKQELEAAAAEVGRHSERYINALLDYQEAENNLKIAQVAYDNAVKKEEKRTEMSQESKALKANSNESLIRPANISLDAGLSNEQQIKSSMPKTGDDKSNVILSLLAGTGAGAALVAARRKLRHSK